MQMTSRHYGRNKPPRQFTSPIYAFAYWLVPPLHQNPCMKIHIHLLKDTSFYLKNSVANLACMSMKTKFCNFTKFSFMTTFCNKANSLSTQGECCRSEVLKNRNETQHPPGFARHNAMQTSEKCSLII
jgi:hypothetical protein